MKKCHSYATAIRAVYGVFALVIFIAAIVISNNLNNWWYFVGICSVYALWIVPALGYAAHLEAVDFQSEQNERMIELLSGKTPEEKKPSAPAPVMQKIVEAPIAPKKPQASETPVKPVASDNLDFIVCPVCQTKQKANRKICFNCGRGFEQN